MADMFPGAAALGDSMSALFSENKAQDAYYQMAASQQHRDRVSTQVQNQGVNYGVLEGGKSNIADRNSPQYGNEKGKSAATEDPQEVEARWTARLAKYAGISQATGVKVGGL